MKTIVLTLQHENWEDDGGAHDAFIIELQDEYYEELKKVSVLDRESELYAAIDSANILNNFPITVDDVLNVWYSY